MDNMMDYLKLVLLVQLFFAVSITMISHALPSDALSHIEVFTTSTNSENYMQTTSDKIKNSLEAERNIPIIELGALVFYSGIIVLDLLMNFILAVPEMMTLIVSGLGLIFNMDAFLVQQLQLFIGVSFTIAYVIGTMQLLTSMSSGVKL